MAHPCPARPAVDANPEGHAIHDHIILASLDAIEIAEIVEYFMERLDVLADSDLATLLFNQCSPYGLDDLRADVTRLVNRLCTSPHANP